MSFGDAVRSCLWQTSVFRGRARRSEYWWFHLFSTATNLLLFGVLLVLLAVLSGLPSIPRVVVGVLFVIVFVVVWLRLFVATLAAFVRRMHDSGHSGAWGLLALVPFGVVVPLIFACTDSDGPNRYGPSPKDGWGGGYPGVYPGQPYPSSAPAPVRPYDST